MNVSPPLATWSRFIRMRVFLGVKNGRPISMPFIYRKRSSFAKKHFQRKSLKIFDLHPRVLARPFPKGTVPFGASNVPFGSAPKSIMCPLAPPHNQLIFNSHLNYLDLKTVQVQTTELSEH